MAAPQLPSGTSEVMDTGLISAPNSNKLQRRNLGDGKDIINNLHECILHDILSLLPIKDAIRTSVLAKNWKYLWTGLCVFDFRNEQTMREIKRDLSVFDFEDEITMTEIEGDLSDEFTMKEIQRVQKSEVDLLIQVLRLLWHSNSNCEKKLRVKTSEILANVDMVNLIIFGALKNKVQELELELSLPLEAPYVLPYCFSAFKSLNKLDLHLKCVLDVPSGISFPSLKSLKLSHVSFANESSVGQLFSGCHVLQELSLFGCDWENIKLVTIKIPTLKILNIFCYNNESDEGFSIVKIDAVNLSTFNCTSYLASNEYVLVNSASIVDAEVAVEHVDSLSPHITGFRVIKLLSGLGNMKSLELLTDTLECLSYVKNYLHLLPVFNNLTHLQVALSNSDFTDEALMDILEALMDILEKTPKLEVLNIPTIYLDDPEWELNSVPYCLKYSLKLFSISNFDGTEAEIRLLRFFLENARVLEEMQIFCSETISDDLKKQAEIRNKLQLVGQGRCVIKFQLDSRPEI